MIQSGGRTHLQGMDYYDSLPNNFRNHALISECYQQLGYTIFSTYSDYVGRGIMDYFSLFKKFGSSDFRLIDTCEHMLQYLATLQDEESYIKQHWLYMWIGDAYYKYRNNPETPFALSKAIENYQKDIILMPYFARQPRPTVYPSLKRLIAIYEKIGDLEKAISFAEMGVFHRIPLQYEYEEKVEKLKKKLKK